MNWILSRVWDFSKVAHSDLSVPLSIFFNSSLQSGSLSTQWLSSIVFSIFKKSSRYDPYNYRRMSLTSVTCKVLERAIARNLTSYLEENSLNSLQQFGFRKGHSTVDIQIMIYEDNTLKSDMGLTTDLIFLDVAKAFDTVTHKLLLIKLNYLGID